MPSYVDFNASKQFRDFVITKTLTQPNGPQTFTASDYLVSGLNTSANLDPGAVDTNRPAGLLQSQNANVFKPTEYFINENLNTIPRKANLSLYPYFVSETHNLIGIMGGTESYQTESELMKFAAWNIKENPEGPFFARLAQNLYSTTVGRVRLIDALEGNTSTTLNLITGREPLIESNPRITVAKTLPGKAIDFLQTVSGVEFPWAEIPGDYLSNPRNPVIARPEATTELGRTFQDITGAIGSLIGIQRRPTTTRKPSDLFIDYMGQRQKSTLFDNLSYSKYAPDYTTTARSQNTSKIFNFIDNAAKSVKNFLGVEAPKGVAYIGDDRADDVKFAMNDFYDRPIRSGYYLSLMFDPIQAQLFQRTKNIGEGGGIGGKLTWLSSRSKNYLGANNAEFASERSQFEESLSTNKTFRDDSILGITQQILETMPTDGGAARSHVANVIDQTSRIFREGDVMISRGSAIKYIDQFNQQESGVEYCRVWTKDRSYMNYSDTMKRTGDVRKFESSVLSYPWNLNIYPNSNGNGGFDSGSTNMARGKGDGFYAKKYMFSIENLAWKLSNTPGFTYNDLPYCERGPNMGRVMWFPPYDLKISEQNSAKWEENMFLGRPEPVYTYQNTSRSGQISFKVIVDHPSILNLLVREHFKGMSDEESDNYINAFFAGCEQVDFYGLIRKYTTLTPDEIEAVKAYLNESKDPKTVTRYKTVLTPIIPDTATPSNASTSTNFITRLYFKNNYPSKNDKELYTNETYEKLYDEYIKAETEYRSQLYTGLTKLTEGVWGKDQKHDYKVLTGKDTTTKPEPADIVKLFTDQDSKIASAFTKLKSNFTEYNNNLSTLKIALSGNTVQDIKIKVGSSTSSVADRHYNLNLSYRRSYSIIKDMVTKLVKEGSDPNKAINKIVWKQNVQPTDVKKTELGITIDLKDFGYESANGKFIVEYVSNVGEQRVDEGPSAESNVNCSDINNFYTSDYLKRTAPVTFWCRESRVDVSYVTEPKEPVKPLKTEPKLVKYTDTPTGRPNTPPIDEIKKIIMKTLSECYYFKKLEEESPIQFSSLKEKLRYFHPAFHSMTPEGLNSRLTFLNQCVRPGDTMPIKGSSDESDLNARNTTFGPPPICVLRIGDFYHSKIIIRDVNITFEENIWDLNPEGIGVQPMIANVQLQVNFIGGHGLERPVERLQNALSSNFYANTEMYDPRSIATEDRTQFYKTTFTKEFLDDLNKQDAGTAIPDPKDLLTSANPVVEGDYIGTVKNGTLDYTELVKNVFVQTQNYFQTFVNGYNFLLSMYKPNISSMLLSPVYRTVYSYTIQTGTGTGTIELLGNYKEKYELGVLASNFQTTLLSKIATENMTDMMGISKDMTPALAVKSEELLKPCVIKAVGDAINEITAINTMSKIETERNNLIKTLDKLNFVLQYSGTDGKIDKENYMGATFTGYTADLLYGAYTNAISFIQENQSKFVSDLDLSYSFNGISMTTEQLSYFLSVLLLEKNKKITDLYTKDPIFTDRIQKNIKKRVDAFILPLTNKNDIKIKKYPTRKNDKTVSFGIVAETPITNTTEIQNLINVKTTKNNKTTIELNYYRAYE